MLPALFSGSSPLCLFAQRLYEATQLVFSSVLDSDDIARLEMLCRLLLSEVPAIFPEFGDKPKFHYGFAHVVLCIQRHGPSPYWSSFAFESRLGDLKRACILVGNNKGVARRGGEMIFELFALKRKLCKLNGFVQPMLDWIRLYPAATDPMVAAQRAGELEKLQLATPVIDVERFEGEKCAFSRGAVIVPYDFDVVPTLHGSFLYRVQRMCAVQGIAIALARSRSLIDYIYCVRCMICRRSACWRCIVMLGAVRN